MNLILIDADQLSDAGTLRLTDARALHIVRVLRATAGQTVRLGIIDGPVGVGVVSATEDGAVTLDCAFTEAPAVPRVDLLLALPRPKVLKRLWAQVAALGVRRIMLTNAERVERNYFDTHLLDPHGYRPLLLEGLQQARDTRLPEVSVHRQFRVLVEDHLDTYSPNTARLVADPSEPSSIHATLATQSSPHVLLAVGPEGGWNEFELALLRDQGFTGVGMGARTLRTDTACVALLALVHDALRQHSRS